MNERRRLYGEISKVEPQEDGTVKVYGYASSEAVDAEGEVIKADAMRAALPAYLKWANVREMHDKKAAGVCIEAEVKEDGRTWFGAHVVDSEACKKVTHKVYKGFSIGGRITSRDDANKSIITGLELVEVSLVDRPANPEAVFVMHKADGIDEPKVDEPAVVEPEPITVTGTDAEVAEFAKALNDGGLSMADAIAAVTAAAEAKKTPAPAKVDAPVTTPSEKVDAPAEPSLADSVASIIKAALERVDVLRKRLDDPGLTVADATAIAKEFDEPLGDGFNARVLAKAGVRHSRADMDRLQAAHDHLADMGASCDGDHDKAAGKGDLAKVTTLEHTVAELTAKVTALEKQPMPSRVVLRSVAKVADAVDADNTPPAFGKDDYVLNLDGSVNQAATAIKFSQSLGGRPMDPRRRADS